MNEEASAIAAIRRHCLQCSGGSRTEVDRCPVVTCSLYAWRSGKGKPRQEAIDNQIDLEQYMRQKKHGA